jgi:hypothetical protein
MCGRYGNDARLGPAPGCRPAAGRTAGRDSLGINGDTVAVRSAAAGHGLRRDAYRGLDAKAAALLHSLARNQCLVDGNKRLALGALIAFYGLNGRRLTLTNDAAYDLVIAVATGQLDSVPEITALLAVATEPHRSASGRARAEMRL